MKEKSFTFYPATKSRWKDFEALFGNNGACGGCWCMHWLLTAPEFNSGKGEENKRKMKKLIEAGKSPGIIAYYEGAPVGWCAFGKRENYKRLANARSLKSIDEHNVTSIVCFYIKKEFRNTGLSGRLIEAVIDYAGRKKIKILEAYPVHPSSDNMPAVFAWTGFYSAFIKAGFAEIDNPSGARPIMRYYLA